MTIRTRVHTDTHSRALVQRSFSQTHSDALRTLQHYHGSRSDHQTLTCFACARRTTTSTTTNRHLCDLSLFHICGVTPAVVWQHDVTPNKHTFGNSPEWPNTLLWKPRCLILRMPWVPFARNTARRFHSVPRCSNQCRRCQVPARTDHLAPCSTHVCSPGLTASHVGAIRVRCAVVVSLRPASLAEYALELPNA